MPDSDPSAPTHRPIRSYVVRAGRLGSGQKRALQTLSDRWVVPFAPEPAPWSRHFGREAPLLLEIGFGMGDATAHIAQIRPDTNVIGVEVHPPGVGSLLQQIEARQLANLRILQHDAVEVLQHMLVPGSLAAVHIYFPDPWHKKRHHKRRLIQPPVVSLLASRLAPGAYLHCATDWQPYAEQMLQVLSDEPALTNSAPGYAPRPDWRVPTRFENRGLRLGHGVWDLLFTRR
jgi:tRNA (guanine-N7-)-methyltransferase